MKTQLLVISLLIFCVSFGNLSAGETWEHFVNVSTQGHQHGASYVAAMKTDFKGRLAGWKSNAAKDMQDYEKLGFSKRLAKLAVEERIRWAQTVIDSNFSGGNEIPDIVSSVENRKQFLKSIAALGYERLQSLLKSYDIKVKSGFNNCLCGYYSISGNSSGFSPARDKHCDNTDPCKGGNFGCSSHDFPKDPGRYVYCAKKYPTDTGKPVLRAISEKIRLKKSAKLTKDQCKSMLDKISLILPLYGKNKGKGWMALCVGLSIGEAIFRYGNWYGPGFWGGYEHDTRAGPKAPVDSLDEIAQRHDFGYALAQKYREMLTQQYGVEYGKKVEYILRSVADRIAAREALKLKDDPTKWDRPPKDLQKAKRYRARMITGFLLEKKLYIAGALIKTDHSTTNSTHKNIGLFPRLLNNSKFNNFKLSTKDIKTFENRVASLIKGWKKNEVGKSPKFWKNARQKKIDAKKKEELRRAKSLESVPFHTEPVK